jgi:hypothetical protein
MQYQLLVRVEIQGYQDVVKAHAVFIELLILRLLQFVDEEINTEAA